VKTWIAIGKNRIINIANANDIVLKGSEIIIGGVDMFEPMIFSSDEEALENFQALQYKLEMEQ
jgi:hypothetical protein